jgi:hypothetical protein
MQQRIDAGEVTETEIRSTTLGLFQRLFSAVERRPDAQSTKTINQYIDNRKERIDFGAELNGHTLMSAAIATGYGRVIKRLLRQGVGEAGLDLHRLAPNGTPPLKALIRQYAQHGKFGGEKFRQLAAQFIADGAEVRFILNQNGEEISGAEYLYRLSHTKDWCSNMAVVAMMVAAGADGAFLEKDRTSPVTLALDSRYPDVLDFVLEKGSAPLCPYSGITKIFHLMNDAAHTRRDPLDKLLNAGLPMTRGGEYTTHLENALQMANPQQMTNVRPGARKFLEQYRDAAEWAGGFREARNQALRTGTWPETTPPPWEMGKQALTYASNMELLPQVFDPALWQGKTVQWLRAVEQLPAWQQELLGPEQTAMDLQLAEKVQGDRPLRSWAARVSESPEMAAKYAEIGR